MRTGQCIARPGCSAASCAAALPGRAPRTGPVSVVWAWRELGNRRRTLHTRTGRREGEPATRSCRDRARICGHLRRCADKAVRQIQHARPARWGATAAPLFCHLNSSDFDHFQLKLLKKCTGRWVGAHKAPKTKGSDRARWRWISDASSVAASVWQECCCQRSHPKPLQRQWRRWRSADRVTTLAWANRWAPCPMNFSSGMS